MAGQLLSGRQRDAVPCEIGDVGVPEGVEVGEQTSGVLVGTRVAVAFQCPGESRSRLPGGIQHFDSRDSSDGIEGDLTLPNGEADGRAAMDFSGSSGETQVPSRAACQVVETFRTRRSVWERLADKRTRFAITEVIGGPRLTRMIPLYDESFRRFAADFELATEETT